MASFDALGLLSSCSPRKMYLVTVSHVAYMRAHVYNGGPNNWGTLGPASYGAWLVPWKHIPPHVLSCQSWSFYVKRYEHTHDDPRGKMSRRVSLLKVAQCHWNRHGSIGYMHVVAIWAYLVPFLRITAIIV